MFCQGICHSSSCLKGRRQINLWPREAAKKVLFLVAGLLKGGGAKRVCHSVHSVPKQFDRSLLFFLNYAMLCKMHICVSKIFHLFLPLYLILSVVVPVFISRGVPSDLPGGGTDFAPHPLLILCEIYQLFHSGACPCPLPHGRVCLYFCFFRFLFNFFFYSSLYPIYTFS